MGGGAASAVRDFLVLPGNCTPRNFLPLLLQIARRGEGDMEVPAQAADKGRGAAERRGDGGAGGYGARQP